MVAFLAARPALVTPEETRSLRCELARAACGEAFVLQGGDCAETFAGNTRARVLAHASLLMRLASVLTQETGLPTVRIGRIAGQYAKPRSAALDELGLPVYRGDIVNSGLPDPLARVPDPMRMIDAYRHARAALDVLRAGSPGRVYASHEALLLDFECAQAVWDPAEPGDLYGGSAHFLWIGERTRQLDGAHVAFAEMLANPVGVKIGARTTPAQAAEYCDLLDPGRQPGRLTLISRMGRKRVRDVLPPIVERVVAGGHRVVWQCDPMHGNTGESATGYKTRHCDDILAEVDGFFQVHRTLGTPPGGLHLELTSDRVTECLGGRRPITEHQLTERYETTCDPRLNPEQAEQVIQHVARLLAGSKVTCM